MLTGTSPERRHDTLRLFQAQELLGPWREHPRSPVVRSDAPTARPAGRVVCTPERLLRFSQDCHPACVDGWHERLRSPAELLQAAARRWL